MVSFSDTMLTEVSEFSGELSITKTQALESYKRISRIFVPGEFLWSSEELKRKKWPLLKDEMQIYIRRTRGLGCGDRGQVLPAEGDYSPLPQGPACQLSHPPLSLHHLFCHCPHPSS